MSYIIRSELSCIIIIKTAHNVLLCPIFFSFLVSSFFRGSTISFLSFLHYFRTVNGRLNLLTVISKTYGTTWCHARFVANFYRVCTTTTDHQLSLSSLSSRKPFGMEHKRKKKLAHRNATIFYIMLFPKVRFNIYTYNMDYFCSNSVTLIFGTFSFTVLIFFSSFLFFNQLTMARASVTVQSSGHQSMNNNIGIQTNPSFDLIEWIISRIRTKCKENQKESHVNQECMNKMAKKSNRKKEKNTIDDDGNTHTHLRITIEKDEWTIEESDVSTGHLLVSIHNNNSIDVYDLFSLSHPRPLSLPLPFPLLVSLPAPRQSNRY